MSDLKDTFDAAEQLLNELQWYADRGIDLSEPPDVPAWDSWADMVRYGSGPTALMIVAQVSRKHDGKTDRYYGEQLYGGSVGEYADVCSLANDQDRALWASERERCRVKGGGRRATSSAGGS